MSTASSEASVLTLASLAISYIAYRATYTLVPLLKQSFIDNNLYGEDMLKPPNKGIKVPEAAGVIGASVYILLLSLFAPLPYISHLFRSPPPPSLDPPDIGFPHHSFSIYLASLLSLLTATFLGFLDDVFDIRWRFKLPIPVIASIPLLITYAAGSGVTDIVMPKAFGLRTLLGIEGTGLLHLGPLYYLFMSMISTFCTNSINILAGINGVEVGQALVIALSILLNDLLYLTFDLTPVYEILGIEGKAVTFGLGLARGSKELEDRHLFSLYFMLPLVGVCFGLLRHNWYPARAFIGDTFCYFSGMAFAVVGILGHFSKTLLLFFLPQVFNFIYSFPQLAGVIPCPRHRLPRLLEDGKLDVSWAELKVPPKPKLALVLTVLEKLRLVRLRRNKDDPKRIEACSNLTILNLILVWRGPMKEERLTVELMSLQVLGSAVAFGIRYGAAGFFYGKERR